MLASWRHPQAWRAHESGRPPRDGPRVHSNPDSAISEPILTALDHFNDAGEGGRTENLPPVTSTAALGHSRAPHMGYGCLLYLILTSGCER